MGLIKDGIKMDFYLPSAAALWFLLSWQPLFFKPFDKIVFVAQLCNRAQPWLSLNFRRLTPDLAGFCQ
jgi:hypothetical protein